MEGISGQGQRIYQRGRRKLRERNGIRMVVDRNKEKFLNELREYLSVLEEQEQEDILAEYAQHIDMKMQKGLSEEDAIRDFGSVKELAAEILAAYHVDSKHAMSVGRRGIWPAAPHRYAGGTGLQGADKHKNGVLEAGVGQKEEEVSEGIFRRMGRWFCQAFSGTAKWIRNGFDRIREGCSQLFGRNRELNEPQDALMGVGEEGMSGQSVGGADIGDGFTGGPGCDAGVRSAEGGGNGADICSAEAGRDSTGVWSAEISRNSASGMSAGDHGSALRGKGRSLQGKRKDTRIRTKEKGKGIMGEFSGAIGRGTVMVWKWFLDCCIFGLRLFWNMGWLLFSLLCAGMAIILLMGIGAMVVLMCSGYSFMGILVLGLGGMLCFGALAAGAFGMMIPNKRANGSSRKEKSNGEVHYEQTT